MAKSFKAWVNNIEYESKEQDIPVDSLLLLNLIDLVDQVSPSFPDDTPCSLLKSAVDNIVKYKSGGRE